jgi:hypothetical protein
MEPFDAEMIPARRNFYNRHNPPRKERKRLLVLSTAGESGGETGNQQVASPQVLTALIFSASTSCPSAPNTTSLPTT